MLDDGQVASRLNTAFAHFLSQRAQLNNRQKSAFEKLLIRLSYQQNQGHNCIQVDSDEQALLLASGLTDTLGLLPLVLEQDRLYLQRYWHYEQRLAAKISNMLSKHYPVAPDALLNRYFPQRQTGIDWQREAAKTTSQQAFSIIIGGPGTGKTTTVVKILAILQELAADQPLHIALAAPTGKAAMRLQEAISFNKSQLPCADTIKQHIPETVTTLHRLLGAKPASPYFHHDANHPLVFDLVVVDEASMVDLALMAKLLDALKANARLILLGDKDQLASVESGAVLADLTLALSKHSVELQTSHRFDGQIKKLATAINNQDAKQAWQVLEEKNDNVSLLTEESISYIATQQKSYLDLIQAKASLTDIFHAFSRFQVLCSNRLGKHSVTDINTQVEQRLAAQKRIHLSGLWYVGRPIIVTQNNPNLQLYNGDIGICLPDSEQSGKLMVFFQRSNGSIKKYLPARIPACETVFAMTIHKSQGSEFDEVLIVLPDVINPVLTKELLYTAVTRAKKSVRLVANKEVFNAAIAQKVERVTGLADRFAKANL